MAHRMALLMYYLIYQCSKPDYKILNYCSNAPTKPENCVDLMCLGKNTSGTYEVFPADAPTKGYKVYCDQESNGGGWMVFQRRNDGELDFLRDWSAYRAGFGSVDDEFWLGNDRISQQTNAADSELLLTLQKTNGAKMTAQYSKFQLAPNTEKFKLSVGGYSGNAGDMLSSRSGSVFTTSDKPSASQEAADCSIDESAWWSDSCSNSNLNGFYHTPETTGQDCEVKGVIWGKFDLFYRVFEQTEMAIRPILPTPPLCKGF